VRRSREAQRWVAGEADAGARLDRFLAAALDLPRNRLQRWIDDGRVRVGGRAAKAATRLRPGDVVACTPPPEPRPSGVTPEPGELAVLYADPHLVVIDKPAGLAVHPGAGRTAGTLVNRLLHRFPEVAGVGGPGRPGIVHRLDKDTTGLLVIARSELAYRALSTAFAERAVEKTYLALVYGQPQPPCGRVELALGRHPRDRKRMAPRPGGRPARTSYRTLQTAAGVALLELGLETGRTHQIRVHMKALGHPLIGDPLYGEARWRGLPRALQGSLRRFPRPALHARRLAFAHPASGRPLRFEARVPDDLRALWRDLHGSWPEGWTD